jgi:hypothetical protein
VITANEAHAQKRGIGTAIGIGIGAAVIGGVIAGALSNPGKASPQKQSSGGGGGGKKKKQTTAEDDTPAESKKSAEAKAQERKDAAANFAKLEEERRAAERARRLERQRNIEMAVNDFVSCLQILHNQLRVNSDGRVDDCRAEATTQLNQERTTRGVHNVRAAQGSNVNQVSAGEIKKEVEAAYESARLGEFERLPGEMWTRDRLMVSIIDRSARQLSPYFKGVGIRGAGIEDLKKIFAASAQAVRARAFETTEIVGVSYSFDRFITTIFENSDRADENLSTVGADGHYERLVSQAINVPRSRFISDDLAQTGNKAGMAQQFHYRFRARRAVYDCLSANYLSMVNSGGQRVIPISGAATQPRMAQLPANTLIGAMTNAEPAGAWQRVRSFVRSDCVIAADQIAEQSLRNQLRPIKSRDDLAERLRLVPTSASGGTQQTSAPQTKP